jgi:ferredoxin-thioredoxin reductase catalytic subunit
MAKKVRLNPDAEVVKMIRAGLEKKGGYCPCLMEKTEDTKCPCKVFRETKECHCELYVTEEVG